MKRFDVVKLMLLLGFLAVAMIGGCSESECPEPECCIPDPTLVNIWPNEDQTAWTYEYVSRIWDLPGFTVYDDIDSVPPAPTMDEVEDLLDSNPMGDNPESVEGIYRLKFDGEITTGLGVTAQNLRETLCTEDSPGQLAGPPRSSNAFLRRLALARPDLRDRIVEHVGSEAGLASALTTSAYRAHAGRDGYWHSAPNDTFEIVPREPLLLHGGPWEKSNEWIGTYGDLDTLIAWKYLESDLEVGHEFTHQLVPALADDVFLHCRILRQVSYETDIGVFEKAIECLYLVDYGIWELTTDIGHTVRWSRAIDYGVVVYAPTVGPVYSYERVLVGPLDSWNTGLGEVTTSLIAH